MFDDEDEVDENDMVLEHGALEETMVDLETGIHFYQLQTENTLESVDSQPNLPSSQNWNERRSVIQENPAQFLRYTENPTQSIRPTENPELSLRTAGNPNQSLRPMENQNLRLRREESKPELVFSPEGNEGFMFTNFSHEPVEPASSTPRELNEEMFMKRYNYSSNLEFGNQNLRNPRTDKIEEKINSVKTAFNNLKLTPRDTFSDIPFEESFTSAGSTASPRSGGYLTDRATSPSAASVTSVQSVSSQVSVSGRRFLEWDYGSDLGYVDGQLTQIEAAKSLSTLEKLAIGNYSEYLKDSDDERNHLRRGHGSRFPPDTFYDETNVRMKKFAESLMRQRQIREQERSRQERRSNSKERKSSSPRRFEKRNKSKERLGTEHKDELRLREQGAYSLPVILTTKNSDKSTSEVGSSPEKLRAVKKKRSKIRKSSSMTEISEVSRDKEINKRSSSNVQLTLQTKTRKESCSNSSSSSRTSQTVPSSSQYQEQEVVLPAHLQDLSIETEDHQKESTKFVSQSSKLSSQSRQSSKRSISNSFETVIAAEPCSSSGKDSIDTEEEIHLGLLHNPAPGRRRELDGRNAWTDKSSEERDLRVYSSVPSTSDEENGRRRRLAERGTGGDTSTMESVQMIDRAKSFEYIPGESFPLQENSSSYEYLPGHLVPEQRPPTVLNLELDKIPGVRKSSSSSGARNSANLSEKPQESEPGQSNLDIISLELRGKSKELLAANLTQTKYFFKKLKRYIDFLSTPSSTLSECRMKQHLASKISRLLSSEETRLEMSSELSRGESSASCLSVLQSEPCSYSSNIPARTSKPERSKRNDPGSDDSSLLSGAGNMQNWKTSRTRSEEKFEKREKQPSAPAQPIPPSGPSNPPRDVEYVEALNRKRTEHLKNLKREIKILEKIERKLSKDPISPSSESLTLQLLESPTRKLTFVKNSGGRGNDSTTITENFQESRDSPDKGGGHGAGPSSAIEDPEIHIQASRSDISSRLSLISEKSKRSVRKNSKTGRDQVLSHTETIQLHAKFESITTEESLMGAPSQDRSQSDISPSLPSSSLRSNISSSGTSEYILQRTQHWNKENRKARTNKAGSLNQLTKSTKPVAYYLPVDSMSPIRIGTRILRESSQNRRQGTHSYKNRNIMSMYMASIDNNERPRVTIPSRPREDVTKPTKLSLQDALFTKRPNFIKRSERRVQVLKRIREKREERAEKHEAWLNSIRCLSPNSRKDVRPVFSPSPAIRLFSHKEMVSSTKHKYSTLPEVINKKESSRKEGQSETNRLRKDIYSRQLKRRLHNGKVSLNHHDRIF